MFIYVNWRYFGWVATWIGNEVVPKTDGPHCAGPREAAGQLCDRVFPKGTWKLHFCHRGCYRLEMLP